MQIVKRVEIAALLPRIDLIAAMERAFVAASEGRAQVSGLSELRFADPPGDVHVMGGHIVGEPLYVVKAASGFYDNPALGLPSSSGLMMLFDVRTGTPRALLLDEGLLTDERTAAAGAVAAKWLAPPDVETIGILGAGIQAERQLAYLRGVMRCRRVRIWARDADKARVLAAKAVAMGFDAGVEVSPAKVARAARLIVTTTPATEPLLSAADIVPGTHITAVGADSSHKGELAADLLEKATLRVADSIPQTRERGEYRRLSAAASIVELGAIIAGTARGRTSPEDISIADLTGVAVQDAAIAQSIFAAASGQGDTA